jgi:hypothetical protein
MLRKIKNFIESKKVTKLPALSSAACDYDCYSDGGCENCSIFIEAFDPEYGEIGRWVKKGWPSDEEIQAAYNEDQQREADEHADYIAWNHENEERWDDNDDHSIKVEMALQMTLFPNVPAWA